MVKYLRADDASNSDQMTSLIENHVDVTGAQILELNLSRGPNGQQVIHINVNGVCLLRVCRIEKLVVNDVR